MRHHLQSVRAICISAVMVALSLLSPDDSLAQNATALDRYEPSDAGAELGGVPDAAPSLLLRPRGELRLSVAKSPLVLETNAERQRVVSHQMILHGLVGLTLFPRVSVDLDVPVVLSQGGENTTGALTIAAPTGASLADLRGALTVQMIESKGAAPDVAFRIATWLPTGNADEFASTGSTRIAPQIAAGSRGNWGAYGLNFGPRMSSTKSDALLNDEFLLRAGGGPRFGQLLLTAEVLSTFQRETGQDHLFTRVPHLEGMLHSKFDLGNWFVRAGATLGLSDALGTPAYRGIVGVGYAPKNRKQRESEPTKKADTRRPTEIVVPKDRDGDKIVDEADQCPDVPGPEEAQGCPADRDQDGISDEHDSCPDRSGVAHPDPKLHGCPLDTDGDDIVDADDACPGEPGPSSEDEKQHGCPKSVRIEGEQILILQQVVFATGSARIASESDELLGEVASIFKAHPEIRLVSIEGHTDNAGRLESNMKLSRARAMSVLRWLIENGVQEDRLQAAGFGPKRPIETNRTREGRQKNRRVEFHIVERDVEGEAGDE